MDGEPLPGLHACLRLLRSADTLVLLADGRARRIADLRVGDEIYGTVRDGVYRRYMRTEVRAHWKTFKPAYRVTLEDGRELVASGDHRFLTPAAGSTSRATGRPAHGGRISRSATTAASGTGSFAAAPADDADYRRGYLARAHSRGRARRVLRLQRPEPSVNVHQFRLALVDLEALKRAPRYLSRT